MDAYVIYVTERLKTDFLEAMSWMKVSSIKFQWSVIETGDWILNRILVSANVKIEHEFVIQVPLIIGRFSNWSGEEN